MTALSGGSSTATLVDPTGQSAHVLQRVVDGPPVRASASSPELAGGPASQEARGGSREGQPSPARSGLTPTPATLLAYIPIVRAEIDRGLEDDTVKVLIALVFIVGTILLWGRWTDAFWMWR